jgi:hypothetical protein
MSHGLTACEVSLEVCASKRCVRSCALVSSAPSRSAGFGGTYLKFTDSGEALFALAARLASNIPSISLQAVSASAKVLNGEPMTLTAPVRAWKGRHEATKP